MTGRVRNQDLVASCQLAFHVLPKVAPVKNAVLRIFLVVLGHHPPSLLLYQGLLLVEAALLDLPNQLGVDLSRILQLLESLKLGSELVELGLSPHMVLSARIEYTFSA